MAGASARPKPSKTAEAGKAVGRGMRAAAKGTSLASRATYRITRRATHADGAGQTGLSRLYEVHALHNGGDAAVAVGLAGTIFFGAATAEARGQVALFLLLTLLPFSVLAPFIGPFLDRFSHGRRWAIGATMAIRAFLCWVLASAVQTESWLLFPAALGVLIASKAYNVTRSAATPRLLPPQLTLVKVNGRMSLAGMVCAGIAAPIAIGVATFGVEWALRFAFVIFVVGTILAVLLPAKVDSTKGERQVSVQAMTGGRSSLTVPPPVVTGFRANVGLRMLSGFLTIFVAFLLREGEVPGWTGSETVLLGLVAVAAGAGAGLGTVIGSVMRAVPPLILVKVSLILDVVVAVIAAVNLHYLTVVLLALVVGLCQQLGKLSLDATIQHEVAEDVRTSVFGRSETLIQLSWVFGGMLGVIPFSAALGMWLVAVLMVGVLLLTLFGSRFLDARKERQIAAGKRPPPSTPTPTDAGDDAGADRTSDAVRRPETRDGYRDGYRDERERRPRPRAETDDIDGAYDDAPAPARQRRRRRSEPELLSDADLLKAPIDPGTDPAPPRQRRRRRRAEGGPARSNEDQHAGENYGDDYDYAEYDRGEYDRGDVEPRGERDTYHDRYDDYADERAAGGRPGHRRGRRPRGPRPEAGPEARPDPRPGDPGRAAPPVRREGREPYDDIRYDDRPYDDGLYEDEYHEPGDVDDRAPRYRAPEPPRRGSGSQQRPAPRPDPRRADPYRADPERGAPPFRRGDREPYDVDRYDDTYDDGYAAPRRRADDYDDRYDDGYGDDRSTRGPRGYRPPGGPPRYLEPEDDYDADARELEEWDEESDARTRPVAPRRTRRMPTDGRGPHGRRRPGSGDTGEDDIEEPWWTE